MSRKSPNSLYSLDIASFTMGASYDQKDALGFINLIGLPIKVRASLDRNSAMKLWGGRFESGPSEVFEQFSGSLRFRSETGLRRRGRLAGFCERARARGHRDRRRVRAAAPGI